MRVWVGRRMRSRAYAQLTSGWLEENRRRSSRGRLDNTLLDHGHLGCPDGGVSTEMRILSEWNREHLND